MEEGENKRWTIYDIEDKTIRLTVYEVLDNFDFEQAHKVMEFMNWEWYGKGIPTVKEIKEHCKELIIGAIQARVEDRETGEYIPFHCYSGGYRATFSSKGADNKECSILLEFITTQSECNYL